MWWIWLDWIRLEPFDRDVDAGITPEPQIYWSSWKATSSGTEPQREMHQRKLKYKKKTQKQNYKKHSQGRQCWDVSGFVRWHLSSSSHVARNHKREASHIWKTQWWHFVISQKCLGNFKMKYWHLESTTHVIFFIFFYFVVFVNYFGGSCTLITSLPHIQFPTATQIGFGKSSAHL